MATAHPSVQPIDIEIINTAGWHIECCREPKFYCGVPFHPELSAKEDNDEEACCTPCVDLRYKMLCPPEKPTHQHCPFTPRRVCPA